MSKTGHPVPWLTRPVWGLGLIGALCLLLAVPINLVRSLIGERETTREEAVLDVTDSWGGEQSVIGPRLTVPYLERGPAGSDTDLQSPLTLLPTALSVEGEIRAEELRRGLFTVPVYTAHLRIRGGFDTTEPLARDIAAEDLDWDHATLVIEVSHVKALGGASSLVWNGQTHPLQPGAPGAGGPRPGVHAPVSVRAVGADEFAIDLDINGAQAIWFAPFGRTTRVALTSTWPHPGFAGAWLPVSREVHDEGFSARWVVPFLGRDYPQAWIDSADMTEQIRASLFGLSLHAPVDHYRMAERSTKYAPLVLVMVFGLLWLFDTMVGIRLHIIQYFLIGAAMCLFYLLELSLSEVIGFPAAYSAAAAGVAGLIAAYATAVLKSAVRGAMVGGSLGLLYGYLLALLALEKYALLAGSLGLFAALGAVMYVTRWVDWDQVGRTTRGAHEPTASGA